MKFSEDKMYFQRNDSSYCCSKDPGEPGGSGRISITEGEGAMLADFASGKRVIEIGTGLGVSTRWLAKTAEVVYTLDIDEWVKEYVWNDLLELGNVVCVDRVESITGGFDMAFIDGRHSEECVSKDIDTALEHSCSLIVGHDAKVDAVKRAFDMKLPGWEYADTTWGLAIWKE